MKKDCRIYLKDILEAIEKIEEFVQGMTLTEFRKDDKTSSAVIRKFEIIGEASKHIPVEVRKNFSEIPWKEMAGMRDRLIHFYMGVDYELVWDTIDSKLPPIKNILAKVIKSSR